MPPAVSRSLFLKEPDPLGRFLLGSVAAHAVGLGILLALNYLTLPASIDLNQKPIKATLVRLGKPRDPNLLPVKEELPPPPKKEEALEVPEPPKEQSKPAAVVPLPAEKPEASAAKRDGEKTDAERRKELLGAFSRTSKAAAKPRELEGAQDGDPNGDSATAEGDRYWGLLSAQVRRNYNVSDTIPEEERRNLKAQVLLFIGRSGEVTRVQLARSSGNSLFDSAVLSAVKKASPFSPPPENLRAALQVSGVVLEFRP